MEIVELIRRRGGIVRARVLRDLGCSNRSLS